MKNLEKEFVKNCDKVGDNTFTLVKSNGPVYLYHRVRMDGSTKGYEVFVSKFIAKGTKLPGGVFEAEDRWQYPGSAAFGKTAYDCRSMEDAENRFDELVAKVKQKQINASEVEDDEEEVEVEVVAPVSTDKKKDGRGRKPANLTGIRYPYGKFTMNDMVALNPTLLVSPATLYVHIQNKIELGEAKLDSKISQGRGKPTNVYIML